MHRIGRSLCLFVPWKLQIKQNSVTAVINWDPFQTKQAESLTAYPLGCSAFLWNSSSVQKSLRRFSHNCPSVNQIDVTHLPLLPSTTKLITLKVVLILSFWVTCGPERREKMLCLHDGQWKKYNERLTQALTHVSMTSCMFVRLSFTFTVKFTLKKRVSTAAIKQSGTDWENGFVVGVGVSKRYKIISHFMERQFKCNNVLKTFRPSERFFLKEIFYRKG